MTEAFGARLRAARQAAGLSQTVLAGTLMSGSYLSLLEAGKREPSEAMVCGLAHRLGVRATTLLGDVHRAAALQMPRDLAHLRMLVDTGDHAAAVVLASRLLDVAGALTPYSEAAAILRLRGLAHEGMAQLDAAVTDFRAARNLARAAYDPVADLVATTDLIRCLRERGELAEALREADAEPAALPEPLQRSAIRAKWCSAVLRVYLTVGDVARVQLLAARSIEDFADAPEPYVRALALWNASIAAETNGDLAGALRLATEASELMTGGERRFVGQLDVAVARLRARVVPLDLDAARTALDHAAASYGLSAAPVDIARIATERARIAWLEGDLEAARASCHAIIVLLDGRHPAKLGSVWLLIARIETSARDLPAARRAIAHAQDVLRSCDAMRMHAADWREVADTFALYGYAEDAADSYRRALLAHGLPSTLLDAASR